MSGDGRPERSLELRASPSEPTPGLPSVGKSPAVAARVTARGPIRHVQHEDSSDTTATRTDDATTDADTDRSAIVVARDADERPDTTEITRLAETAGYDVVDRLTQRRQEGSTYNLGRGKAEELARRVAASDADAAVFDDELTPGQYRNLAGLLPNGTRILDRRRVVLDIFGDRTGDEAARLQVELATLRYELPRIEQTEERTHMQEAAETGSRLVDTERRIRTVERKLKRVRDRAADRRAARREEGFDLVAIAGYTNAGKSTLLHRFADDLSVDALEPDHADLDGVAAVEDRLFVTLDTTTRRATIGGRRVLLTDTVGLVDGLPHDLVESFSTTLQAVAESDVALLVADASDPVADLREKLQVSLAELDDPRGELVCVLTKVDLLDDAELAARRDALPDTLNEVVAVSAVEGTGVDRLRGLVADALPHRRETVDLPNAGSTQAFLAWAHEHGNVVETTYGSDRVRVVFEGKPELVSEAVSRAARVREGGDGP